jgi:hypothetical protein
VLASGGLFWLSEGGARLLLGIVAQYRSLFSTASLSDLSNAWLSYVAPAKRS